MTATEPTPMCDPAGPPAPPAVLPLPDPDPAVADLLASGRQKFAAAELEKERRNASLAAAANELQERRFAPLRSAFWGTVPESWRSEWVEWCDDDFRPQHGPTHHAVMVNVPGLAPLNVCLAVRKWTDPKEFVGEWGIDPTKGYSVPVFTLCLGADPRVVVSHYAFSLDLDQTVARARDSAEQNARLKARAAEERRVQAAKVAELAAKAPLPPPTAEERLTAALKEVIIGLIPASA